MNVLIIPEDFRKDQYILKPIFESLLAYHGKPRANIRICNPPLLQGVTEALKTARLREVVDRYPFVDLFILCVDRDGALGRKARLVEIERIFSEQVAFYAENAWEELETWLLAGLKLPAGWAWADVRSEVSCKERYFEEYARILGIEDGPGGGRRQLGIESARRVVNIINKCPEDFGQLSARIEAFLQ